MIGVREAWSSRFDRSIGPARSRGPRPSRRCWGGSDAAAAAAALGARAFTAGDDIYFGAGEYAPGTATGDRLLVHELTHVVQFDDGRLATRGPAQLSHPDDATEREASAMEARADHAGGVDGALEAAAPSSEAAAPETAVSVLRAPSAALHGPQPAQTMRAPAVAPPVPPARAYRSGQAVIQRAMGFEIQTQIAVRTADHRRLDYKQRVFLDHCEETGRPYFEVMVDHAPVLRRTAPDAELADCDSAVLEVVMPHVSDRKEQWRLAVRADAMRRALAILTANGTKEARIEHVVAHFEELLSGGADVTDRADGIRLAGAIVGQHGDPGNASTSLPQVTVGVPLASLPGLISIAIDRGTLTDARFADLAAFLTRTLELVNSWGFKDADTFTTGFVRPAPAANSPPPPPGPAHGPKMYAWLDSISDPARFPLDALDLESIAETFYILLEDAWDKLSAKGTCDLMPLLAGASNEVRVLAAAITTPADGRPMPDHAQVKALFTAIGHGAAGDLLCTQMTQVTASWQARDLMSRGEVHHSATSMGTMKVPHDGPEQGMAILENRMMPPWQTPVIRLTDNEDGSVDVAEDDQGPTWAQLVIKAFDAVEEGLAFGWTMQQPDDAPGPPPEGSDDRDRRDGHDDRDGNDGNDSPRPNRKRAHDHDKRDQEPEKLDAWSSSGRDDRGPRDQGPSSADPTKRNRGNDGHVIFDDGGTAIRVRYLDQSYAVIPIEPDGDCLFECAARFVRDGSDVQLLRDRLAQSAQLTSEEQNAIRVRGTYAGANELAALADELQIAIVSHEALYGTRNCLRKPAVGTSTNGTLHVLYHFAMDGQGHCDLLQRS